MKKSGRCQVRHIEITRRVSGKEGPINRDLAKYGIRIWNLVEVRNNGKKTYAFDMNRMVDARAFRAVRRILRKHLGIQKGGAR